MTMQGSSKSSLQSPFIGGSGSLRWNTLRSGGSNHDLTGSVGKPKVSSRLNNNVSMLIGNGSSWNGNHVKAIKNNRMFGMTSQNGESNFGGQKFFKIGHQKSRGELIKTKMVINGNEEEEDDDETPIYVHPSTATRYINYLENQFENEDKKEHLKNTGGLRMIIDQIDDLDEEQPTLLGPLRKKVRLFVESCDRQLYFRKSQSKETIYRLLSHVLPNPSEVQLANQIYVKSGSTINKPPILTPLTQLSQLSALYDLAYYTYVFDYSKEIREDSRVISINREVQYIVGQSVDGRDQREAMLEAEKYQNGLGKLLEGLRFFEQAWHHVKQEEAVPVADYYTVPKEFILDLSAKEVEVFSRFEQAYGKLYELQKVANDDNPQASNKKIDAMQDLRLCLINNQANQCFNLLEQYVFDIAFTKNEEYENNLDIVKKYILTREVEKHIEKSYPEQLKDYNNQKPFTVSHLDANQSGTPNGQQSQIIEDYMNKQ